MPRPRLKNSAKRLIRNASQQAVSDYFQTFPRHERRKKWLRVGNRYRVNCIKQYRADLTAKAQNHSQLTDYIAASSPAHVIDGWSLLGRAVDCALRRDAYSTIHLGYYAELRAAMALLACEGIGILDRQHAVIDGGGTSPLPKTEFWNNRNLRFEPRYAGTHAIVGPCLRYWATLPRAANLLDTLVQPNGIAISEWLYACGAQARTRAVAQGWLRAWGIDLSSIDQDRDARNLASYRPSEFRLPSPLSVEDILHFIRELWQMFEPSTAGRFLGIEQYLLRRALRSGQSINPTSQMLRELALSSSEIKTWLPFLSGDDDPSPFVHAQQTSKIDAPACHIQVLSRAALLLYVATSAVGRLLRSANYSHKELEFWWRAFGETRGLWDPGAMLTNPRDIWADIKASLDNTSTWVAETPVQKQSLWGFCRNRSHVLSNLGAWDIVAVWGLLA